MLVGVGQAESEGLVFGNVDGIFYVGRPGIWPSSTGGGDGRDPRSGPVLDC